MILAAVLAFLVVFLFYLFAIRPKKSELSDLQAQVQQENNKSTQLRVELQRLQQLQANAPKAEAELSRIKQFVPESNEVPDFMFEVQAAADRSDVGFVQITPTLPKTPPEGASVAEVQITIGAQGGYFAIQDFVRRLYDLRRALRIDTLSLTGVTDDTTGTTVENLQITARIFFELPPPAAVVPVPGETVPAPVVTPTPATIP
jgi:Tfp pilus assembly protein PilO